MVRPRRRRGPGAAPDAGMVTVELALGLLAVVVVLGLVLGVVAAGSARASLCQAVREAAREASVGGEDPGDVVARSLGRGAGSGAAVSVSRQGRWVEVSGTAVVGGPAGWAGMQVTCEARTLVEGWVP